MELLSLSHWIARGWLLLCAIVVVGLSITWIKFIHWLIHAYDAYDSHDQSTSPFNPFLSALGFDIFAGVFALVDVAAAVAAGYLSSIPWMICTAVDAVCALFLVAGGLATIVILKKAKFNGTGACNGQGDLRSLCTKLQADAAFLFIGSLAVAAAAALFFMRRRKQSSAVQYPAIQHGVEL